MSTPTQKTGVSAAEKLKALDARYALMEDEDDGREIVWVVLPQIVAVVEAAERLDAELETNSAAGSPNYLIAALAALDEALT